MKVLIKIIVLVWCGYAANAQDVSTFKKDFKVALDNKIPDRLVDSLMAKHYNSLMWFYTLDSTVKAYPLKAIKNEGIYRDNIVKLFADTSRKVNTLACLLAASAYDTVRIAEVKKVLKLSNYKNMLAAKSLMVLGDRDLNEIARCIIAYNFNETVQYLTIDFLSTDKVLLEKFAVDNLFNSAVEMQYLAVKAMASVPLKPENDLLLRKAVINYEKVMKGWAISALAHLKAKNMLPLVSLYLDDHKLKQVSWRALAASTSVADMNYMNEVILTKQKDVDFLNALLNSENEVHLRAWLSIMKKGDFPEDYFIDMYRNEAIKAEKYFDAVCEIIKTSTQEKQAYALMRYFDGRKDKATKDFLNACLAHPLADIREKAKQLLGE